MSKQYIIESNIKKYVRENKLCVSPKFFEALDYKVFEMTKKAMDRAKKNGRTTLLGRDI